MWTSPRFWQALVWITLISCSGESVAPGSEPYVPKIAPASKEGELARNRIQIPAGWQVHLAAAEPLMANPVAFAFDERGRIFVAETFRQSKGVEDNRSHMSWLLDDLSAQTVSDRLKFFEKHQRERLAEYAREHDRLRLLEDRDEDGHFEHSTVYADGFSAVEDGTGAGVLAWDGDVFYTCIPKLWRVRDKNGDGVAEERTALQDGYGVRVAFRGHDLHGLVLGPDGRIYFSIGDRGFHIETPDGILALPDQGAVFRCERDGSKLEVFATGLRNPQELAFDNYGRLFTGDNNSDSGDRARWVYVMEGGDTGWRMYYQYLADRGPWNREKLWHPPHAGQPAYIVPPLLNFADGPSGLAFDPGVGLPERYRDHFFLADFRGTAGSSGIRSFAMKEKGAGFEMTDAHQCVWAILATDVDFDWSGNLCLSDWVDGWEGLGKGRIYRITPDQPVKTDGPAIMKAGLSRLDVPALRRLLAHPDRRIRQRAQFALADRGAAEVLQTAAQAGATLPERLHGVWGLWQLGRKHLPHATPLAALLTENDPAVRATVAQVLGDLRHPGAGPKLLPLLRDPNDHVQAQAALALGKLSVKAALTPLQERLAEVGDADPWLRYALIAGLCGCATSDELAALSTHAVPAVRLAAVVGLRRQRSAEVARFLNDPELAVIEEAARAIHDPGLTAAFPQLAQLKLNRGTPPTLAQRVINANYRLGTSEHAAMVAQLAASNQLSDAVRIEALKALLAWNAPAPLDRVTNESRQLPPRTVELSPILQPVLGHLFSGPAELREVATALATEAKLPGVEQILITAFRDLERSAAERSAALAGVISLGSREANQLLSSGMQDKAPAVRNIARQLYVDRHRDASGAAVLKQALLEGTTIEQQTALRQLASLKLEAADATLVEWADKLATGAAPPDLQLDILHSAETRATDPLKAVIQRYRQSLSTADPLAPYRVALQGGDPQRGREIFLNRSEVSCRRCHQVAGNGGEVGPNLTKIGAEKTREYLLESIVDPNKQIAKGFETLVLQTDDGKVHSGILKNDDGTRLFLATPDRGVISVLKSAIEDRAVGKSGMPEDLIKKMSLADLRDLVAYLAELKQDTAAHGK